jgi:glyoxylate reductase
VVWPKSSLDTLYTLSNTLTDLRAIQRLDSPDRADFIKGFGPGGKYESVVAVFRDASSSKEIGVYDEEIIEGISKSVKWIAHNGAGYDNLDVQACKARGTLPRISLTMLL